MRLWQLMCFVLAAAAGLIGIDARSTYGARLSADEPQYLLTAISLFEDQDLDIGDEIRQRAYLPFHEITVDQQTRQLTDDGQQVSPHDPLLPILVAIPVGVSGWVGAKVLLALLSGATAAVTFTAAVRRFQVPAKTAALVVTAFFIASPFAPYGAQVYPAIPAALVTTVAFLALTGRITRSDVGVAVLAITALPWLSVKYVPMATVLAAGLLWRAWAGHQRKVFAVLLGLFAIAGVAYLVVHQRIWGGWTVYASGDHFTSEFEVVGANPNYVARTNRLLGLLVDRYFGLAAWSPAFLFMPAGLVALLRSAEKGRLADKGRRVDDGRPNRGTSILAVAVVAVGWAVATWVALTMHGWWWPGRQVVPVLPLVVVGVAVFAARFRAALAPILVLGVVGFVNWAWMAVEASTGRRALIIDHEDTANPLFQGWKNLLPDHRVDGVADQWMTVAWGVGLVASAVWAWRACDPASGSSGDVAASANRLASGRISNVRVSSQSGSTVSIKHSS